MLLCPLRETFALSCGMRCETCANRARDLTNVVARGCRNDVPRRRNHKGARGRPILRQWLQRAARIRGGWVNGEPRASMSGCLTRAAPRTIPMDESPQIGANRAVRERSLQRTAWQRRSAKSKEKCREGGADQEGRQVEARRAEDREGQRHRPEPSVEAAAPGAGPHAGRLRGTRRFPPAAQLPCSREFARRSRARDWAPCCRSTSTTFATPRAPSSASGRATSCCATP